MTATTLGLLAVVLAAGTLVLAAVGVFVFDEDGLIKVWRKYYDLATLQKAMTP